MIINLRGTHGSGKSTIVRKLLECYVGQPTDFNSKGRPNNYVINLPTRRRLYIVGPYVTACGGADAVQPYALIWPRVEAFALKGDVLFEGALVSSSVGNIGRAMAARKNKDCVVAFMDTPLETCLSWIAARRIARGDERPLNPKNTAVKFEGIIRSRPQLEALGLRCVDVPHGRGVATILALLGVKNAR